MIIGFDAKRAFHNFTGLGNYSRFILNALNDHYPENEYHLFTPTLKWNEDNKSLKEDFHLHTAKGIYKYSILKAYWRSFVMTKEIQAARLELYHGLSNELPVGMPTSTKKIVTIHDLIFMRYPNLFSAIDRKIYEQKFRAACKNADHIVAISKQTKQDIIEFFKIDPAKITVIYQGVHENFHRPFSKEELIGIKSKYNLPQDFILYVGTLEERKNALVILKALKAGRIQLPLVLLGKSTPYQNELRDYMQKNDLEQQIMFLNDVSFSDLPGIYDLSILFIYPSIFEGFGIPVLEALYRNTPVITSRGSCLAEAGGELAEYINPLDEEELADKIRKQVENKGDLDQQKLEDHLSRFSTEEISKNLMELYKKIA